MSLPSPLDYAAVFDAIPVPATLVDGQGTILSVNEAFLALARSAGIQLRPAERVGRHVSEFVTPDFQPTWDAFLEGLLAGRPAGPVRQSFPDGHGGVVRREIRGTALRGGDGRVAGAIILRADVTADAARAERLEETTRLLEACQRIGEQVVASLDLETVLDTVALQIVQAGILRSLMVALVHPEDGSVTVVRSLVCQLDGDGNPVPGTARRADRDVVGLAYGRDDPNITAVAARTGQLTLAETGDPRLDGRVEKPEDPKVAYFIPLKLADRVVAVLATASRPDQRDATLRRLAMMQPLLSQVAIALQHARLFAQVQASVRDQRVSLAVQRVRNAALQMAGEADWAVVIGRMREELAGLVELSGCGVQLLRPDGGMVGYSAGRGALQAYPFPVAPAPVRRAVETGQCQYRRNREEMRQAGDDEGLFLLGARSVIDVPFEGGTLAANSLAEAAFSPDDVAVLGQFAAVMSEAHRRYQDLRDLEAKERQLQRAQKMEVVGQLTAGVAHNFNNMLQGVVGNLELALLDANAAAVPAIEAALQGTQRAAEVVQQLMAFSRGGQARPRRAVNLAEVIADTEAICRRTFDRRIHLSVVRRSVPPVVGDPLLLQQVFLNLCLNARDAVSEYSQSLPAIRIAWEVVEVTGPEAADQAPPGPYVRVDVADNGRGMDEGTQKRLFEPFFSTKPVGKGTGLSTAFGIVRDHGGWIACQSQPGAGARFCVYLPVSTPASQGPTPPRPASAGGRGETILVVDDEEMIRETARQMLELRGYQVLVAADGEEALEIFRRHRDRIGLVLLDQSMPGLTGRQILQRLRQRSHRVRLVIFTGYPADAAEFDGADDLVRKPFTLDGLAAKVREVLDRPA